MKNALHSYIISYVLKILPCISLPIGTNSKPLAAIYKLSVLLVSSTNGEESANTMIGNDVLAAN